MTPGHDGGRAAATRREVSRAKLIVVKIGSSLLAPGGELDRRFVGDLARQTAALVRSGRQVLIVTSGAISAGLKPLGLARRPAELPLLQAAAAAGQGLLMHAYQVAFGRQELVAAQVLITRDGLEHRVRFLNARNTLMALLDRGAVPVINENDTVSVDEIRYGDNDRLSALVASLVGADLLVLLSGVPGLLAADGSVVGRVDDIGAEADRLVRPDKSAEGTGGMASKLEAAALGRRAGFHTVIAGGREPDVLTRLMEGEPLGTWFVGGAERTAARKQWLAFTQKAQGRLVIDDGAVKALVERKKSLLPSGIVRAEGSFPAGAGVSIVSRRGREVARGISNYSSRDVERIKGLRTSDLAGVVGEVRFDEVVHRDNLSVL